MTGILKRAGLALAALVAIGLLTGACGGDDLGDDDDGGVAAYEEALDSAGTDGDTAAAPGLGGEGASPDFSSQVDRKVIFDTSIELEMEDPVAGFNEAQRLARNSGGYVESSSLAYREAADGEQRPHATVTIRVPAGSLPDVLASLRTLDGAKVLSEGSTSQEVTEEYTDLQSRLRNLEETEQQYLDLLAKATTIDDILTVNDRLNGVRSEIEMIQGRINLLDNLTDFATITVTMEPAIAVAAVEDGSGGFSEAFENAWESSVAVAKGLGVAAIYAGVAALWLAVPAAIAGGIVFAARKRRGAPAAG